jgi:hypothetical protein
MRARSVVVTIITAIPNGSALRSIVLGSLEIRYAFGFSAPF